MTQPKSIWQEYGFKGNPYSTDPIDPSEGGRELLVGRSKEFAKIARHLTGGASVVALEGDFGVGKTSLAAAAAYDASQWKASGGALFIPTTPAMAAGVTDHVWTLTEIRRPARLGG